MTFSKMASLNGVHMFLKSQNTKLLETDTPDSTIAWREFEDSITIIAIASGCTKGVLEKFVDATFNAMVMIVGLDEIKNPRNLERLKRDLRTCNPIIDKLLECLDSGDRIAMKTDLLDMTDCIMSSENHLLQVINFFYELSSFITFINRHQLIIILFQVCLDSYTECLDSMYGCVLIHGCLAVATENWWTLDPLERKLMIIAITAENNSPAKELPVFLPNKSPNVISKLSILFCIDLMYSH